MLELMVVTLPHPVALEHSSLPCAVVAAAIMAQVMQTAFPLKIFSNPKLCPLERVLLREFRRLGLVHLDVLN